MGMYGSRGGLKISMPMRSERIDRRAVRLGADQSDGGACTSSETLRSADNPREPGDVRAVTSENRTE